MKEITQHVQILNKQLEHQLKCGTSPIAKTANSIYMSILCTCIDVRTVRNIY